MENIIRFDYWDDKLADAMVEIATNPELKESLKKGAKEEYTKLSSATLPISV